MAGFTHPQCLRAGGGGLSRISSGGSWPLRAARLPVEPNMVTLRFWVGEQPRKRAKKAMDHNIEKCPRIATFLNVPNPSSQPAAKPHRHQLEPFSAHLEIRGRRQPRKGPTRLWINKLKTCMNSTTLLKFQKCCRNRRPSRTGRPTQAP